MRKPRLRKEKRSAQAKKDLGISLTPKRQSHFSHRGGGERSLQVYKQKWGEE